jgi:hypothetical protein
VVETPIEVTTPVAKKTNRKARSSKRTTRTTTPRVTKSEDSGA